jgi:hypothetical protein
MDVQLQWFGIALTLSTIAGCAAALVLLVVALLPVRRADTIAGLALALAALIEGLALLTEWGIRASLNMSGHQGIWLGLWDVITVVRPLGHLVALALVALAALRLARRGRAAG